MATFSNNFFLERKSENIQDNSSTKMWTKKWNKYFIFVINDQTTFMYLFKIENFKQILTLFLIAYFTYHGGTNFCFFSTIFCFRRTIFCFSSTIFCFFQTKKRNTKQKLYFRVNSKHTKKAQVLILTFPNIPFDKQSESKPFLLYKTTVDFQTCIVLVL